MSRLPSLARRTSDASTAALVGAFESDTQAVFLRTRPYSEHAILHVLVGMIVLAVVLMFVGHLDRVVDGSGRIVPSQGVLYVQPIERAIVRDIRVRVGDVVRQGQILGTLDPTFAGANLAQLEQKQQSAAANLARLEAEQSGEPYHPTAGNPYEILQQSIYQQRQGEYRSSLADFDARIQNAQATINRLEHDAKTYGDRRQIAANVEQMNLTLERQGWNSKLKTMAATDNRMEVDRLLTQATNQIAENQHLADALKAQRAVYIDRWRSDTGTSLVDARKALDEINEEIKKAQKLRDLVDLTAPADAIVTDIGKISVGSVIDGQGDGSGDPLFTLARLDAPLEAEIDIEPRDIGFIRTGDPVEIKLDAYRFLEHGTAKGEVRAISEGSFAKDDNNQPRPPYFRANVTLKDIHLRDVPETFRLIPGMTLTGDIIVGKRSIISYIIEGALRTGSEAMREP
ncbi:MAG: HlyD family type I secretion periplasmic adaptor subunit [Rhodospirillales bacterium]|nr:HlyD family type I secretion periplasmic adaptor subunit [Rhodospirillales bacterium]